MNSSTSAWRLQIPDFALEHDEVRIFSFEFSSLIENKKACVNLLTQNEITRAGRFIHMIDFNRFVVGRTIVRTILSQFLECRPHEVTLKYENGRPMLAGNFEKSVYFNITHSGKSVMVALSSMSQIGIDVELPRTHISDLKRLACQVMTDQEYKDFIDIKCGSNKAFYRLWVRKEAVLKCIGSGFLIDPRQIHVGHEESAQTKICFQGKQYDVQQRTARFSALDHLWAIAHEMQENKKKITVDNVKSKIFTPSY